MNVKIKYNGFNGVYNRMGLFPPLSNIDNNFATIYDFN
jgi:hypothetical protein